MRYVLANPVLVATMPPGPDSAEDDERTLYLGFDHTGRDLEVVTVNIEDGGILVLHAMDLRPKYRATYEAALTELNIIKPQEDK